MDLLVVQLKAAIRRLLDAKGVRARVLDRVNRFGEVVIGVILEKTPREPPRAEAEGVAGDEDRQIASERASERETERGPREAASNLRGLG
jgi:hypothetical protein